MGVKRPLEQEDLPELSFKQPKQLDNNIKLTFTAEDFPTHRTTLEVDSPGQVKSNFCKLHYDEMVENGDTNGASVADKELEASAPLSLVTSSSSEEDAGNEDTSILYNFPGYIEFSIPWRPPQQYEDPYISLLNSSPRKEVPVGPDYQAEVPEWDPSSSGKDSSGSNNFVDNEEQRLMGSCVLPMPGLNDSSVDGVTVGRGRTDCSCLDMGSMRCVQQHVKEAREKLRETIGDETFTNLGFYDMGEEVAWKWSAEDERIFHNVIFSNPASHGRNFWKHLSVMFPTRTKKELISYYFNVFMLRRRAVQNRSYLLQIDSDDDEEPKGVHGDYSQNRSSLLDQDTDDEDDLRHSHGDLYLVRGEDEDSTIESFGDQDLDAGWVDDYGSEPETCCRDEGSDNNHDTSDGEVHKQDAVEMDGAGQDTKN
ncbi:UNVERIFIED_CONTAM: AT-rich interactive domain-containing protein 2 [Sesamum calycinum]|uniref:AT-rich interactive domain-containing protein 2 n=1 Tax=Sesamum calycinum TaxID=2727403 RepID=A0AAW2PR04_9LAMI